MKGFTRMLAVVFFLAALAIILLPPLQPARAEDAKYRVLVMNVGKADAILLSLDGAHYLVDTGTKDSYGHMEKVLELYGITTLDGVFITHTDKDHVGGLKKLLKSEIVVKKVYSPVFHNEASNEKHNAFKAADKQNIPYQWLSSGDVIISGECRFEVLGPISKDPQSDNNNSLVMNLVTPLGNVLLTGDMEYGEEAQLLEAGLIPPANVLKVAHHGDNDATSTQLLQAVKPEWAIISTSTKEEPDTPDESVLISLWQANAGVAVTQDAEIGIMVSFTENGIKVEKIDFLK